MAGGDLPDAVADVGAVDTALAEIREVQKTDPGRYWEDKSLQAQELALMQEKLSPESRGVRAVVAIRDSLDDEDWQALSVSFPGLSDAGLEALRDELASEPPPVMGGASFADVEAFRELPEARALLSEWGMAAPHKLAVLRERMWQISRRLGDDDYEDLGWWFDHLSGAEAAAVERVLAG